MTIPTFDALMLPVLAHAATKLYKMSELVTRISDDLNLTAEDRQMLLPGGSGTTIASRVGWAKTFLKKAGLVEQPSRGMIQATTSGRELLARNPAKIDTTMLREYEGFLSFVRPAAPSLGRESSSGTEETVPPIDAASATPNDLIDSSIAEIDRVLRDDLLVQMRENSPAFFERLIVNLMIAMGYGGSRLESGFQVGGSGDGGIDGVIYEDRLGLDRVLLQAKRYNDKATVSAETVQSFVGALASNHATKGVLITTATFSKQAIATAAALGSAFRMVLIDGEELCRLMVRFNVGVRVAQTVEIKKIDLDFFDETAGE
ncbi:MAG: restriction endonuclease [Janthinobacterium lividum]